jgi:hypothetical protein
MRKRYLIFILALMPVLTSCGGGSATPTLNPDEKLRVQLGREGAVTPKTGVYEKPPEYTTRLADIPVLRTVLKSSPNYVIDPLVEVDGYYYNFTVRTKYADYQVLSVRKLIRLCHEIDVVEHFRETDKGGHVMSGVSQSAAGIGRGFGNLILHPVQSVKRAGQGAGKMVRATGGMFSGKKIETLASDGRDRALMGKGPAGGERRGLAYQMGIDVYTDNPITQELVNNVARKRLAGKLPLTASVFALPGGAVFTLSLTPMGFDPSTEEIIRDNAQGELRFLLAKNYKEQFGLDYQQEGSAVQRLLDNPNYSPREQAYLWRYLKDLSTLEEVGAAFEFLAQVNSPERAEVVSAQMEMLSLLHQRARRLVRFVPIRNTLAALAEDNSLCIVISIDTVRYWSDVRTSLDLTIKAARDLGARQITIWSTGDIDAQSVELARKLGVNVRQDILENPVFQRARDNENDIFTPSTPVSIFPQEKVSPPEIDSVPTLAPTESKRRAPPRSAPAKQPTEPPLRERKELPAFEF